ncbi:MAG: hydantoinase B/oxoprolinase family protein [Bdellovibrionales bacterium]|nr:hydantoinase B/oxoprolinase family protein [Bdellovibrionales bacterium]
MNRLEAQSYLEKMRSIFNDFARMAVITADHETLYMKTQAIADISTLPHCAELSHKYLQLQDGDIVITNDPYSGGTILSSPTLILGIGTRASKNNVPAELLVAYRLTLTPRVGAFKTIDDEGLRIPPSPYYLRGDLNTPIVEALKGHPLTSKNFIDSISSAALELLALREKLKNLMALKQIDFSKPTVKAYLKASETEFLRRLDEIGEGATTVEVELSNKETIKLKAEHRDDHFTFDFTGTTAGETVFLTDTATIGTTIGTVVSFLKHKVPLNSGIFSRFDVRAPRGTLVNSSFPRPLYLGHTDGVNFVANCVSRAVGQMHKKYLRATTGASHCGYQIEFRDKRVFTDSLPFGTGGRVGRSGLNGIHLWRRFENSASIEKYEQNFPILFLNSGYRAESAGEGRYKGGLGVVRTLKVLEDAELSWNHISPPHKPEGLDGGKSGLGPEMILQRVSGEKEDLPPHGTLKLAKGDILTVLSPGGGGYGVAKT